MFINVIRHY